MFDDRHFARTPNSTADGTTPSNSNVTANGWLDSGSASSWPTDLTEKVTARIRLPSDELLEWLFVPVGDPE
jgi:hypothetical protein